MPKRICAIHGLWEKENSKSKCPKCSKLYHKNYDRNHRDKEMYTFYRSARWKKVRAMQLRKEPLCVECNRVAGIVDHIKEIKDGGEKLNLDNLQSMCKSCHSKKTAREKRVREGSPNPYKA
jgi:5-methylcytosine-specific restriction endonuclease McrA